MIKKLIEGLFLLLILALLIAPLVIIRQISLEEMKAYEPPAPPALKQTAYGEPMQARRMDVADRVTVSGTWVSLDDLYQELDCREPWAIRWRVQVGDELREGQPLGTYKGKELTAEHSGLLLEINSSAEDAYLRIRRLEATALECRLDGQTAARLSSAAELQTEHGSAVRLIYAARVPDADGAYTVRLSIEGAEHIIGETEKELTLLTGQVYRDALVLDERCVYQKQPGDAEPWYALRVGADGTLMGEVKLRVAARVGSLVCIGGVSEGEWFDSGYRAVVQSAYGSGAGGYE